MNKTGIIVIIITIFSKVIGFLREVILSRVYGASSISDAFVVATTIPAVIMGMVATSVTTGYVPVYNRLHKTKGREEANKFTYNLMTCVCFVGLIFMIIGLIVPELYVRIFATKMQGEAFDYAVQMTRISILCLLPLAMLAIHVAFLNANLKFLVASGIGIPMSAITILFIYISKWTSVYFLGIGIVLSYVAQFIIVYLASCSIGFRYKFYRNFFSKDIKHMLILVFPLIVGTSAYQINTLVDRAVASGLGEGAISSLNYALRINGFIQGIFITTLLTVMYPLITRYASNKQIDQLKNTVRSNIEVILFLVIPMILGGMIYSKDVVKILFMRGAFDENALQMTSIAMYYYLFAMLGVGLREIFFKIYYSMEENRVPMYNALINVILNIVLNIILSRLMGIGGLALATTISSLLCSSFLYLQLRKKIKLDSDNKILIETIKVLICGFIMAGILLAFNHYVSITSSLLKLIVGMMIGGICYLVACVFLRINGLREMIILFNRKFKKV